MPSSYEFAVMSEQVYLDGGGRAPLGWEVLTFTNPAFYRSGYYACAYYNRATEELVIAHRGTKIRDVENLKSCLAIIYQELPVAHDEAAKFMRQARAEAEARNFQIHAEYQTGHSLGAMHAMLEAASQNVPAVVFDSPSCAKILKDYCARYGFALPQVTSFLGEPNLVNYSLGEHYGNICYVDTLTSDQREALQNVKPYVSGNLELLAKNIAFFRFGWGTIISIVMQLLVSVMELLEQHSISGFVKALNPEMQDSKVRYLTELQWRSLSEESRLAQFIKAEKLYEKLVGRYKLQRIPTRSLLRNDSFLFEIIIEDLYKAKMKRRNNPRDVSIRLELAKCYALLQDKQRAMKAIRKFSEYGSGDVKQCLEACKILFDLEERNYALSMLQALLPKLIDNFDQQDTNFVSDLLQEFKDFAQESWEYWYLLAKVSLAKGNIITATNAIYQTQQLIPYEKRGTIRDLRYNIIEEALGKFNDYFSNDSDEHHEVKAGELAIALRRQNYIRPDIDYAAANYYFKKGNFQEAAQAINSARANCDVTDPIINDIRALRTEILGNLLNKVSKDLGNKTMPAAQALKLLRLANQLDTSNACYKQIEKLEQRAHVLHQRQNHSSLFNQQRQPVGQQDMPISAQGVHRTAPTLGR